MANDPILATNLPTTILKRLRLNRTDTGLYMATVGAQNWRQHSQPVRGLPMSTIAPRELLESCKSGKRIELLDVRTPLEYQEVHVEFARNVPLDQLDPVTVMQARNGTADQPLYVVCRSGARGQQACERFFKAGFPNVANVEGGTLACIEAGLPVVRGRKVMSLERQVRIAAGSLVLLGVVLGWLVHPALLGIAAFVGAGLVFSGITDTCGMGLLLAKMPWNRCDIPQDACCTSN
jgi:rhodanese-related sulfurtransferase